VDAVVGYHRVDDRLLLPAPEPQAPFGAGFAPRPRTGGRPGGALSLVDRTGAAAWFAWGAAGAELDSSLALNAAEAIDALLGALAGGPEEPP
jgi:hypothetical protein